MTDPVREKYEHAAGLELVNEQQINELSRQISELHADMDRRKIQLEHVKATTHERLKLLMHQLNDNRETVTRLQVWLDDYVSESVWPRYLVGNPKDAFDPAAAAVHAEHLFEGMTEAEIQQFYEYQKQLRHCLDEVEPRLMEKINDVHEENTKAEYDIERLLHVTQQEIAQLDDQLQSRIDNRRHYLTVEPPLGDDADELKWRMQASQELGRSIRMQGLELSAPVDVENLEKDETLQKLLKSLPEGSVQTLLEILRENNETVAEAQTHAHEVMVAAEETEEETKDEKKRREMLQGQQDRLKSIPASRTVGLRKKLINELAGRSEGELRAYKHWVMQLNRMEPVGDKIRLYFDNDKQGRIHAKEMIALRAGVDVSDTSEITVLVHDRLSDQGNVLRCEILGHYAMADIAVAVEETKNGKLYVKTCLNADPDWTEVENNCEGVKPNRSQIVNDDLDAIPTYIEYFKKIDDKLRNMPRTIAAE